MAENLARPTQKRRADSPGTFGFAMASEVPQKFGRLPTAPACTRPFRRDGASGARTWQRQEASSEEATNGREVGEGATNSHHGGPALAAIGQGKREKKENRRPRQRL